MAKADVKEFIKRNRDRKRVLQFQAKSEKTGKAEEKNDSGSKNDQNSANQNHGGEDEVEKNLKQ